MELKMAREQGNGKLRDRQTLSIKGGPSSYTFSFWDHWSSTSPAKLKFLGSDLSQRFMASKSARVRGAPSCSDMCLTGSVSHGCPQLQGGWQNFQSLQGMAATERVKNSHREQPANSIYHPSCHTEQAVDFFPLRGPPKLPWSLHLLNLNLKLLIP